MALKPHEWDKYGKPFTGAPDDEDVSFECDYHPSSHTILQCKTLVQHLGWLEKDADEAQDEADEKYAEYEELQYEVDTIKDEIERLLRAQS